MVKKLKKQIKSYVGASMMYGGGMMALGAMGTHGEAGATAIGKGAGMMGVIPTAMGASAVMRVASQGIKKKKKKMKRYGGGSWGF